MNEVGFISIASADPELTEKVSAHLDQWLVSKNWKQWVSVLKKAPKNQSSARLEIVFEPGENQSNGELHFSFEEPNFEVLNQELENWLFNIKT